MAISLRTTLESLPAERPYVWKGRIHAVSALLRELDRGLLEDLVIVERDGSILTGECSARGPSMFVRLRCADCARPSDRLRDGVPACDGCARRP